LVDFTFVSLVQVGRTHEQANAGISRLSIFTAMERILLTGVQ
jgi:hypothetical protein